MPFFFNLKGRTDAMLEKVKFFVRILLTVRCKNSVTCSPAIYRRA